MPINRADFDNVMVPNYAPANIIPVRGEGSYLWDQAGNKYIDFAGGIAVNCLGHCHPKLVEAVQRQASKVWHLANVMTNEPAIRLATKMTNDTFGEKVYFANSGAESNEAALKLARRWALDNYGPEKSQIISFKKGFHGRTFFTVSVGGQASYSDGFGPKPGDIVHAEFNNLDSLKELISDKTCAVVLEPVQGEGGVLPATTEFMSGIRRLCNNHNALMILDEVQTGVGRTGKLYAYEHYGITPDILTTAKALGGGFPIGAMITTTDIAKHLKPGTHGSTYGGNPLACHVAETVWDIVNQPELLAEVERKSGLMVERLQQINNRYKVFKNIRGKGLLIGCELIDTLNGRAKEIVNEALNQGLMILVAGANVVRFAPSLIIEDQTLSDGLDAFEKTLALITEK